MEEVLGDMAGAVPETDREQVTVQENAALLGLAGMLVPVHVAEVVRGAVVVVAEARIRLDGDQGAPAPAVAETPRSTRGVAVQVGDRDPQQIAGHERRQELERVLLGDGQTWDGLLAQQLLDRGQLRGAEVDLGMSRPPTRSR